MSKMNKSSIKQKTEEKKASCAKLTRNAWKRCHAKITTDILFVFVMSTGFGMKPIKLVVSRINSFS